jgi:hypothetical protein
MCSPRIEPDFAIEYEPDFPTPVGGEIVKIVSVAYRGVTLMGLTAEDQIGVAAVGPPVSQIDLCPNQELFVTQSGSVVSVRAVVTFEVQWSVAVSGLNAWLRCVDP